MASTRAVSAGRSPAPLADVALFFALPSALVLAFWAGLWFGPLIGVGAVAAVLVLGRGTYDEVRTQMIGIATLLYLVVCGVGILIFTTSSYCSTPSGHGPGYAFAGMGQVFVGITLVSLWRRFFWGIPLAVLLGFVTFVAEWSAFIHPRACY